MLDKGIWLLTCSINDVELGIAERIWSNTRPFRQEEDRHCCSNGSPVIRFLWALERRYETCSVHLELRGTTGILLQQGYDFGRIPRSLGSIVEREEELEAQLFSSSVSLSELRIVVIRMGGNVECKSIDVDCFCKIDVLFPIARPIRCGVANLFQWFSDHLEAWSRDETTNDMVREYTFRNSHCG